MTETVTSYIIDFTGESGDKQNPETEAVPNFSVSFCPNPIVIGEPFRVIIQGDPRFEIEWPYAQSISLVSTVDESYSMAVDIGGSDTISPAHPVSSLQTIKSISPIIEDTGTGLTQTLPGNTSFGASPHLITGVHASAGVVKLPRKSWGTVRIGFKSHTRYYQCGGLPNPGEHVVGFNFRAPITLNGIITGHSDNWSFHSFQVSGSTGTDTGREDFCSDINA